MRADRERIEVIPVQQSCKLWKETPSSVAGAFWLVSCAGQSCGVVPSARNAMVVSCSILSKYGPCSSHHLADSVCTPGPSLAWHLHPSLSTLLERDEITQEFDLQHTFDCLDLGSGIAAFKTSL